MLPSIAIGLLVNFYQMPIWLIIGVMVFYIAIMIMTSKNQKAMHKVANKRIEIAQNKIELKETNGSLIEKIEIENIDKLIVKGDYKMAHETMKDLKEEIKGNTEEHYIIIESNNKQRRLDFVIESYYMLNQLKKLVRVWESRNLLIEYVE
jgi:hypothetical protein